MRAMPVKPTISFENLEVAFASKSNAELRKMYLIFATLNKNWLSNLGIKLANLSFQLHLPIKGILKKTMFGIHDVHRLHNYCGNLTLEFIQN